MESNIHPHAFHGVAFSDAVMGAIE